MRIHWTKVGNDGYGFYFKTIYGSFVKDIREGEYIYYGSEAEALDFIRSQNWPEPVKWGNQLFSGISPTEMEAKLGKFELLVDRDEEITVTLTPRGRARKAQEFSASCKVQRFVGSKQNVLRIAFPQEMRYEAERQRANDFKRRAAWVKVENPIYGEMHYFVAAKKTDHVNSTVILVCIHYDDMPVWLKDAELGIIQDSNPFAETSMRRLLSHNLLSATRINQA